MSEFDSTQIFVNVFCFHIMYFSIKILDDIDFTLPNYAIGKLYTGYKSATVSVFPVQHVTVDCKVRNNHDLSTLWEL